MMFQEKQKLGEFIASGPALWNTERSLGWSEKTVDSNLKLYEEIKNTGKGNYIGTYKSQYYCNFWFVALPPYDLKDKGIKQQL